jgi:predicted transcriptional regulator
MSDSAANSADLAAITAGVVAAFVSHNSLPPSELVTVIQSVHEGLAALKNAAGPSEAPRTQMSAAQIRQSIRADYLICLDDGKKFKSLRRHLGTLGMTPEQYRAKWGLPPDYPMVAPNYSAVRSALARGAGQGHTNERAPPGRHRSRRPSARA